MSITLKRKDLKNLENLKLCNQLIEWFILVLGDSVKNLHVDNFLIELQDGIILSKLILKYGQVYKIHEPKQNNKKLNKFLGKENIQQFIKSCNNLSIRMVPNLELDFETLLPCLLELASLADQFEILQIPLNKEIHRRVSVLAPPPAAVTTATVAITKVSEKEKKLLTTENENNKMLNELYHDRMDRQRKKKPKEKIVNFGENKEYNVSIIERPGEAIGSVMFDASIVLCEFLSRSATINQDFKEKNVLELGSGVGLVGIFTSIMGANTILTDRKSAIDLTWSNISANANAIVSNGGAAAARVLDWTDKDGVKKLHYDLKKSFKDGKNLDIIIAADVVYGPEEILNGLANTVGQTFKLFENNNMQFYLCYKRRSEEERLFFSELEQDYGIKIEEVGTGEQFGEQYKAYLILKGTKI